MPTGRGLVKYPKIVWEKYPWCRCDYQEEQVSFGRVVRQESGVAKCYPAHSNECGISILFPFFCCCIFTVTCPDEVV